MPLTMLYTYGSSLVGNKLHEIWNYKPTLYPLECLAKQLLTDELFSTLTVL